MSVEYPAMTVPVASRIAQTRPVATSTVMLWELRRYAARKSTWVMCAAAFGFFAFLTWFMRGIVLVTYFLPEPASIAVTGTSAWGMVRTLIMVMLLAFGMFLPFVAAGGVARDLKQRTHEIVMSTPVSTQAYVWGRYLAVLAVGFVLAFLMLLAIFVTGYALHLGPDYPPPNVPAILAIWATVVPATVVLVTGGSFALGTLLPRFSNPVKIVVLTAWFLSLYLSIPGVALSSYPAWDPTSRAMAQELFARYRPESETGLLQQFPKDKAALEQMRQGIRDIEQRMPDLLPWVPPKLAYAGLGLAFVAVAAAGFQRFRNIRQ
jgi:ABC-type transport system involved in multi-copper enzyme maturation permease subunit